MSTADLITTVIFSALAIIAGATLLYTWISVERSENEDLVLGVAMMCTIAGVAAFSTVMVITSLATLPAWLRVLLALLAGIITAVTSRNLWYDQNMALINVRARNKAKQQTPDGESSS